MSTATPASPSPTGPAEAPGAPPTLDLSETVRSAPGTPTWEIARFYPRQGDWSEEQYLSLDTNQLVEFDNGVLEFLPTPSIVHQLLLQYLFDALNTFVSTAKAGTVVVAPYHVRVADGKQRDPDVLYVPAGGTLGKMYTEDAALVAEVVSEGAENRQRDLVDKRAEYAAAGISEYWIVDPEIVAVTVLTLPEGKSEYAVHGEFKPGETATSVLLEGFAVDVTACFAAAEVVD